MVLLTALAVLVALALAAANLLALRAVWQAVEGTRDQTRVLLVALNGIEAGLAADIRTARESADAAAAQAADLIQAFRELQDGAEVETPMQTAQRQAILGRVMSAKALFAAAEEESLRMVKNG